jgi:hypothetical protein
MITLSPGMKKIETPAEYELNQYNFFEHALQISALAKDIMEVKTKLKELEIRKKITLNSIIN